MSQAPITLLPPNALRNAGGDELLGEMYRSPDLRDAATKDVMIRNMNEAHDRYRIGFKAIKDALGTIDPTRTTDAAFLIHARAQKWLTDASQRGADATTAVERAIATNDREIDKLLATSEGPRSAEIRAHFKNLPPGARVAHASEAIKKCDKETLGALLAAPAYLSGLTDEQQAALGDHHRQTNASDLMARQTTYRKSRSVNLKAHLQLIHAFDQLFPKRIVEEISQKANKGSAVREAIFAG